MSKSAFQFQMTGMKEIMDAFDQLPTISMQKSAVRNALKKAGQPVMDYAQAIAPHNRLKRSIAISTTLKASQRRFDWEDRSRVTVYVGSNDPTAHLVEFGTTKRYTKKGVFRGSMGSTPFMRLAWDTMKYASVDILKIELWSQIQRAARRLYKKSLKGTLTKGQIAGLRR